MSGVDLPVGKRWPFQRYVRLSLPRLWMRDLVHFGRKSMVVGGSTSLQLAAVAEARRHCQPLIGWSAIVIKAMALTAQRRPELRRAYIPFPWPHLYEHPTSVVSVVIERKWQGENAVFFDQILDPEHKTLREIDAILRGMKLARIESLGGYRRLIRITRFPLPLRRLLWRIALQTSGRLKARYFGTVSLNSLASRHSRTTQSVTPVTMSLEYGPVQPGGEMPMQIFFDHRVMDGAALARFGADIQAVLNREIVAELRGGG